MDRKTEILNCFESSKDISVVVSNLIDEMIFIEGELSKLKKLPHLRVHSTRIDIQEETPANKVYNSKISRYTDIVGKLCAILKREEIEEDSPLRMYMKNLGQNKDE